MFKPRQQAAGGAFVVAGAIRLQLAKLYAIRGKPWGEAGKNN